MIITMSSRQGLLVVDEEDRGVVGPIAHQLPDPLVPVPGVIPGDHEHVKVHPAAPHLQVTP